MTSNNFLRGSITAVFISVILALTTSCEADSEAADGFSNWPLFGGSFDTLRLPLLVVDTIADLRLAKRVGEPDGHVRFFVADNVGSDYRYREFYSPWLFSHADQLPDTFSVSGLYYWTIEDLEKPRLMDDNRAMRIHVMGLDAEGPR